MILPFLLGMVNLGNPPLKGDKIEPFTLSEPGVGVYTWKPGKVTVLTAFAYWCDTWKTQRERIMTAQQKLKGVPVDFLAVSVDGQWMDIDKRANWSRRLIDSGSRWCNSIGIDRVPYSIVINSNGTIMWSGYGIARSDDLVEAVRQSFNSSPLLQKTIYLSFDDFPAKSGNQELLDALRSQNARASLFVIGENAEANPKWIKRAALDGNRLEVHGWRHTVQDSDPVRCRAWIENQIGQTPKWIRGPGSSVVRDFKGQAFRSPDIDPYDFLRPSTAELTRRIISQLKSGSTLHLHAGVAETVAVLPEIIRRGKALGYQFEPFP